MKQRILAFLTAFCMVLALLPAQAFASEHSHSDVAALSGSAPSRQTITGTYTNPLYESVPSPQRLTAPQYFADGEEEFDPGAYFIEYVDVLNAIRSGLEARSATFTVPWRINQSDVADDDAENTKLKTLILTAALLSMSHTGVPTQGDYLLWHYYEIGFSANRIATGTDDYYYLDITFAVTYYTTAEQEAALTAKLETVMASFGFTAETDDYTKVKAIYDYICANVVYDHANLEDEAYTLKFSAYAALMNGTAVCQGYATLFYRMLLMAGVDTRVIAGTSDGVNHAWNIVKLGDVYYNADSTWDAGKTEYSWLLKSPSTFTGHTRDVAYESTEFHAAYPMAAEDYAPAEDNIIASGKCGDQLTWALDVTGTLTISGTGSMANNESFASAPWYSHRSLITSVFIENGVTTVANSAFYGCTNMTSVSIPNSIISIGSGAFYSCFGLTSVNIPNSVTTLESYAFDCCSNLTDITIGSNVNSIGNYAFSGCESLTSIIIPSNVTSIGEGAFSVCPSLSKITFTGQAPLITAPIFEEVTATASYPCNDSTWTETIMQNCGGTLTWNATHGTEETIPAVPATCKATGLTEGTKCSVCGEVLVEQTETPKADHTEEVIPAVPATCKATGLTEGTKCSVCGEVLVEQTETPKLDHTWGAWSQTTAPTENDKGEDTRVCSACGETETREVPALGHLCQNHLTAQQAKPASCTEDGTKAHYLCSCGKIYEDAAAAVELTAADLVIDATGHTVTPVAAEPATCTETGTEAHYVCSCGKLFSDAEATAEVQAADLVIPVTDHTWGDWVQTTPPTEDEKGEETRECSVCHTTETQDVDALGHICANHLTAKDAVAPTCTATGTKAHYQCSCGKLYSDANAANEVQAADLVVAATGHTEETIPAVAPTCTETGLTEGKKCSVCGEILTAQETVDVLGHTWGDWVQTTAPTEDQKGEDTRECSVCHETETREVPALGHICKNHLTAKDAVAPTCTETGTKAHYLCSCGKLYSDADATTEVQAADLVVAATGHTEATIPAVAPTCTKTGLTEGKKCSVCDEILTAQQTVPATGHTWGDWAQTTAPTEGQKGEDTRECSVCHETETREVPALGHICANHLTAKDAVAPTCTATGTKAHYQCSCGKLYSDANAANEVQAADLVVAATGHTEETIPAVAPTCTETGLTEGKKCSVCGEILTAQETIPATGHTEETIPAVAPTCTKTGLTEGKKCSVCGEILTAQQTVPSKGHSYVDGTCTVCGAEDPGFIAGDFTGDDIVTNEDVSYLLWHTLFPDKYPLSAGGDFTGDGVVTNEDVSYLLWFTLFPDKYPLYPTATVSSAVSTTSDERGKKK